MRLRSAIVVSLVGLMVAFGVVLVTVGRTPSATRPTTAPTLPMQADVAGQQRPTPAKTPAWPEHHERVEPTDQGPATVPSTAQPGDAAEKPPVAAQVPSAVESPTATILVAGDIASCSWSKDRATARLLETSPGVVMTAGDNAYQTGTFKQFRDCYGPTWGRFRERTRPALGNHDWATPGAAGYFRYFGDRAGPPGRGYYAFSAGTWRVYALVSDCPAVGGCRTGSDQHRWLKAELGAHPQACVLAVWHQPRYSSGPHGTNSRTNDLLKLLYNAGAEVVINGHDHFYERFAKARPDGTADPAHGVRQFIVGTGGGPLYPLLKPFAPNSTVRNDSTHGVLRLTLEPDRYAWEFLPVQGETFTDDGAGACHGPPPA